MNASVKKGKGLIIRVHVTLSGKKIEEDVISRLRKKQPNAHIKGFRRGKVPIDTLKQIYGAQAREESMERLTNEALAHAIRDKKIQPAMRPVLESSEETRSGDLKIVVVLETYPKVGTTRYNKIRIKKPSVTVQDKDVDTFIERLRRDRAKSADVNADQTNQTDQTDSQNDQELPPLGQDFFASYGVKEGGEKKFREVVLKELTQRVQDQVQQDVRMQLFDGLLAQHEKMLLPNAMVQERINIMLEQESGGSNKKDAPPSQEEVSAPLRKEAERRVKLGLIMNALAKELKIKAESEHVREYIESQVGEHPNRDELVNWYYTNEEALRSVESAVSEKILIETLLSKAKVREVSEECSKILYPESTR